MILRPKLASLVGLSLAVIASQSIQGATTILNDSFTAVNVNSGFLLGEGLNTGITNDATRLEGTAAANLRYLKTGNKNDSAYTISSNNKANISQGSQSGRFTISADGTNAFDFASVLSTLSATPSNPAVYEIGISMNNRVATNDTSIGRMTFAFGTEEAGGQNWSIGVQILPTVNTNYNVYRRIKLEASGVGAELNSVITNAGVPSSDIDFLIRITDAGMETETYSSRAQISLDDGATWFYDTQTDPALTNGFRFEAATRYVSFDQAPNGGAQRYDDFSITLLSAAQKLTITNNAGSASISLQGTPNQSYVLERSQDLNTWFGISTNVADATGFLQFSEIPPTNPTFYRSREE